MAKLKVFRTAIGFHDALVAAPSRRAALAAWGASADLFARGVAEEVSDPALTEEPLARPGEVIRRSRGSAAEQLAALPPDPPRRLEEKVEGKASDTLPARRRPAGRKPAAPARGATPVRAPPPPPPRPPKPSPVALDAAETALADGATRHRAALAELAEREERMMRERQQMERGQAQEAGALERDRDDARRAYDAAMRAWRAGRT